jgi:hypothetical protein
MPPFIPRNQLSTNVPSVRCICYRLCNKFLHANKTVWQNKRCSETGGGWVCLTGMLFCFPFCHRITEGSGYQATAVGASTAALKGLHVFIKKR